MYKILFVCTGNICRSPTAEGVLRHELAKLGYADQFLIDSAGTHDYHVGESPDNRSMGVARKRGVALDELRARQVTRDDFFDFDLILACDSGHLRHLQEIAPKDARAVIALFLEYAGDMREKDVPDPYYGDQRHFEHTLDLIEAGVANLAERLKERVAS